MGYVVCFEFLWFLEMWSTSHAVVGVLAAVAIQRLLLKFLIACFMSREFKHDESNRAFWTGRWYGRGLGSHAFTQPLREYVVKIVELSMFAGDCITGHLLLYILFIPTLIPYIDTVHSVMLMWLKPSDQSEFRTLRDPIGKKCRLTRTLTLPQSEQPSFQRARVDRGESSK